MKFCVLPSFVVALLLSPLVLWAQDQFVIDKKFGDVSTLDVSGFRTAGKTGYAFFTGLRTNLKMTGYFKESAPLGAELRLQGSATGADTIQVTVQVLNPATRKVHYNRSFSVNPNQINQLAQQVSDEILMAVKKKEGFARSKIVMVGSRPGVKGKDLYMISPDGTGLRQITRDATVALSPMYSPDGRQIVYTSYLKRFPDLYLIELRSGKRRVLAKHRGVNLGGAISPDGRFSAMILSAHGKPELYVKNIATGKTRRLTNTRTAPKASPCWSPDGNHIVFVSGHTGRPHLYRISRDGGAPVRISRAGLENVGPDWGENGLLAFSRRVGSEYQIAIMDPLAANPEATVRVLTRDAANYEDPSWAPNGRHLVCSRTIQYQSSLYILDSKDGTGVALTQHKGDWYMPDWSPK